MIPRLCHHVVFRKGIRDEHNVCCQRNEVCTPSWKVGDGSALEALDHETAVDLSEVWQVCAEHVPWRHQKVQEISIWTLYFFMFYSLSYLSCFSASENVCLWQPHEIKQQLFWSLGLRLKASGLDISPGAAVEQADLVLLLDHSREVKKKDIKSWWSEKNHIKP